TLSSNNYFGFKIEIFRPQSGFNGLRRRVYLSAWGCRHKIPLLRRIGKSHCTTLRCSDAMVNQFYSGVLFIIKTSGKKVVVHKDVDPLRLEILKIIEF